MRSTYQTRLLSATTGSDADGSGRPRYNAHTMRSWVRKAWPLLKALLTIAILIAIGRQFARDLSKPELWQRPLHPGWMVLSAALYLLGLGFSAVYWYRLLIDCGQHPSFLDAVRAHYIGQMGKYLPGKAWALFLRSSLVRNSRTRVGVAVLTSFYEVFTTMSSGALLAAVLFAWRADDLLSLPDWHTLGRLFAHDGAGTGPVDPKIPVLLAVLLLLAIGIPTLPWIFNRLVRRIALPFRDADAAPLPTVRISSTLEGLLLTPGCWLLMGTSLWAALEAAELDPAWSWESWGRYTAFIALAYVAGFIIVIVPSGLGVREALLLVFLVPDIGQRLGMGEAAARSTAALAVILLRLLWTAGELVVVGVLYWLPAAPGRAGWPAPAKPPEAAGTAQAADHGPAL